MGNVHMEATQINYRGGSVKKSVEEAIKDAIELTPEQKTNINKIPTIEAAVATKAAQSIIAPEFDSEAGVYAIGDLVMYEGKLYEFTSAHETPGDWDSTEVSEKTVADEVDSLKSGLTELNSKLNWTTIGAEDLSAGESKSISTSGYKDILVYYGIKNGAQSYMGASILLINNTNKPCSLPVYNDSTMAGTCYIAISSDNTVQVKNTNVSSTMRFMVFGRV